MTDENSILNKIREIPFGPEPGSSEERCLIEYLENTDNARVVIASVPKCPVTIVRITDDLLARNPPGDVADDPTEALGLSIVADAMAGSEGVLKAAGPEMFTKIEGMGHLVEGLAADTFTYVQSRSFSSKQLSVLAIQFSKCFDPDDSLRLRTKSLMGFTLID